ncbi:MAG: tetratricopeptide repeat protein [Bacteroidota bacterium]
MSTKKFQRKNKPTKSINSPPSYNKLLLVVLIIVTAAIYFKSLNNQLTTWDDKNYITENKDIRSLHGDSINYTIKETFSSYVMGNYHPLTMLTYCMEYAKYKLNPKPYHVTNLIIHLLNALLVFAFIWLLTQQQWVAFITALLFAIHPMHVESVAWVAERKDVLYSFFYLSALCTYLVYLKKEKGKWIWYTFIFLLFILGLLSKAMTVTLPIVLFAIDYFLDRKFTGKVILEKLPFIVVSFIFGYIAIEAQKSANAIDDISNYNFFDRILFTSYGIITYLWKMIAPINLSCFYDYPTKVNGMYPAIFYIAPIIILVLAFLIYRSIRFGKDIVFGFGFFLITIVLVLQILPVGGAIIADRYTYLPYIGIFFILARWINNVMENKLQRSKTLKIPVIVGFTVFSVLCCYLTVQRCKIWNNSLVLWNDVIEKYDASPKAYNGRGDAYTIAKKYDKAVADLSRAIQLKSDYPEAYYNRGLAYYYLGKHEEAISDYTSAIQYNPKLAVAYYNRAGTYFTIQKFQPALEDVLKAKQYGYDVDPGFIEALQTGIKNTPH